MLEPGSYVRVQIGDEQPIFGVVVHFDFDTGHYLIEYYIIEEYSFGNENLIEINYISCYPRYCFPIR